jgi:hypothetical protein
MGVSRSAAPEAADRPSLDPGRPSNVDGGWFAKEVVHSVPPPPSVKPLPPPIGRTGSSLGLGMISGALGAFLMLLVVQLVVRIRHAQFDFVRAVASSLKAPWNAAVDPTIFGIAAIVLAGAGLGALLGGMTRRVLRVGPRLVFFAVLSPVLLLFLTVVLRNVAPDVAARLPFGPLLLGSIVYGVCVAIVVPRATYV